MRSFMKRENRYKQWYQEMRAQQEILHRQNRRRIRIGIRLILFVPLLFLLFLFLTDSRKVVFLTLWIASLFLIAAYLIYVEYADFRIQRLMADLSKKEAEPQSLLPDGADHLAQNTPELLRRIDKKLPDNRKNIRHIVMQDFRNISTNVVATILIIGLSILPSLYAWFNILSNWDPYEPEATSHLKIAVVSLDKGVTQNHIHLCIGDTILDSLASNTTMGWQFPENERTAINGVYNGDYYAALIIPDDFSQSLAGILDGDLSGGTIAYYENEKKNAIATKITSKAKTTVQNQVNRSVFATVTETMLKIGSSLEHIESEKSLSTLAANRLQELQETVQQYIYALNTIENTTAATDKTMKTIRKLSGKLIKDLQEDLSLVPEGTIQLTGLQTANLRLSDFSDTLKSATGNVKETKKLLQDLLKLIKEAEKEVTSLSDSDALQNIMTALTEKPDALSGYVSSLIALNTVPVYETENYGSSMAPFYTVLAIWVGALILVAVIHTKVHRTPQMTELKTYQEFWGRYLLFFLIGQAQTLICVLGDLFFLEIQCEHPLLFWLAAAVSSFVFTIMIYSLTFVLGNVGEALAVVIMVIQVAGTGGTFPKEVLPAVYQKVFDFLPFPYCMTALRECVSGMYQNDYWKSLSALLLFAVVFLAFGLFMKKPLHGIMEYIEKCKEKSDIMV